MSEERDKYHELTAVSSEEKARVAEHADEVDPLALVSETPPVEADDVPFEAAIVEKEIIEPGSAVLPG